MADGLNGVILMNVQKHAEVEKIRELEAVQIHDQLMVVGEIGGNGQTVLNLVVKAGFLVKEDVTILSHNTVEQTVRVKIFNVCNALSNHAIVRKKLFQKNRQRKVRRKTILDT